MNEEKEGIYMEQIPHIFQSDKIFQKTMTVAEIAKLSYEDHQNYQISRMQYLEIHSALETAYEDGLQDAEKYFTLRIEEERQQKEEERRQKEEERQQKEEERKQKEDLIIKQKKLANRLIESGMSIEDVASYFEMDLGTFLSWREE